MKKWGKYLPMVTLLFPGGLFIFGAWLAVDYFRRGGEVADEYRSSLIRPCRRVE